MKRSGLVPWLGAIALCGLVATPSAAQGQAVVSPNVETNLLIITLSVGETSEFDGSSFLPPSAVTNELIIDALHQLSSPGQVLFSLQQTLDLATSQATFSGLTMRARRSHVLRFDGLNFSHYFCGITGATFSPDNPDVDAVYITPGGMSDLILSFAAATTVSTAGETYEKTDLVRFRKIGPDCDDWEHVGFEFDADGVVPDTSDVIGATATASGLVFALEVATTLGSTDFEVGSLVLWDGLVFSLYQSLPLWPSNRLVTALSVPAAPTAVPDGMFGNAMRASRATPSGSAIDVTWDVASCTSTDFHLIFGDLATLPAYSVAGGQCGLGAGGTATVSALPATDLWFLIVANDGAQAEGSWGDATSGPRNGSSDSGQCGILARSNLGTCP